ncbi:GFA family protein [Rhizobium sp. KVB221]|uniref:GFA family protein n=1 Tax=Rhizobium setariae TaxID=2801340 RepID=A0A936YSA1_9HYPH|nr:GFA family protein [Rhizobium setariae]
MKGGCLCGAVRYTTKSEPRFSGFCHCRDCQRATGTGHCCYMIFDRSEVAYTGKIRAYSMIGGSGEETIRYFCETCGSQIFGSGPDSDPRWSIYAGTLDDPSEFAPQNRVNTYVRPWWDHAPLDIPEFEKMS